MKKTLKAIWLITKEAASKWWAKDPFRESATIAYYAIFSMPALLAIVVAISGFFFGRDAVNGQISEQVSAAMSAEAADQIEQMIVSASEAKKSTFAAIIGFITLIFGATGVLVQLQKSLNNIWEVKVDPKKKQWWHTIQSRLFSLGIIATLGFLLLISMAVTVALAAMSEWINQRFPDVVTYLIEGVNFIISLAVIAVLFSLMFKILPDAKIKWKHVIVGGILTASLFVLGKFALGFYFGKSDPASAYGAAGSVVLILLWVSYSSMIVFFGAEFTRALVMHSGDKVVPKKNAIYEPGLNEKVIQANSSKTQTTSKNGQSEKKKSVTELEPFVLPQKTKFKKWFRLSFILWPAVSILLNAIPFLLKFVINKILGKSSEVTGKVKRIRLTVFYPGILIKGLQLKQIDFSDDQLFDCSAEWIRLSFSWKALWKGVLICSGTADGIHLNFTKHKKGENLQTSKFEAEGIPIPLIIQEVNISNSKIGFTDTTLTPILKVETDEIGATMQNLSTLPTDEELPARASVRAHLYDGILTMHLKANIAEPEPAFDLDAELIGMDMVKLNDFFKAYGKFDVNSGSMGFFTEIASKDGEYKGYVKPIIRKLDVHGPEDKHESFVSKIWESTVGAAATLLKNQPHDQLATKIPFEGKYTTHVFVGYAILETLVNAFVQALKPSLDYEINIGTVNKETK